MVRVLRVQSEASFSTNTSTSLTVLAKLVLMINQRGRRRRPCRWSRAAASALAWFRQAQTTPWPAFANIFAPSSPTPEFAPVTMSGAWPLAAVSNNSACGTTVPSGLRQALAAAGGPRRRASAGGRGGRVRARRRVDRSAAACGGRWARARARRCKGLQVQNASSMYRCGSLLAVVGVHRSQKLGR